MRIRMFSLCAERELTQRKLEAKIADSLHGFASNEIGFEDFSTPQEMLAPLAQSLKEEALTVVAVEKPSYNKIKKKLLPAMGYILDENEDIRELVSRKEGLDEKKITSHSLFPTDAKIFPSYDGMFSAFAVQKGSKLFIMLPLDKDRIDLLLEHEIIPYLVRLFGEPLAAEEPVPKKEKADFSDPLVRSVNLLKEANAKVAFCANRQEPIIDSVIKSIAGSNDLFVFSPHVEDRGDIDVVSYSVQLARAAKNLSYTELGAVISDPFDDDNGRGVCISITDGEKAIARRFYAEDGESDESLVAAAAREAISLLGQNAYGVLSENAIGTDNVVHEKVAEKKTVKIILIILVIVLALCIGAGVLFKYLDGRKNNKKPTESTTVTTTVTTTEKEKVEPVVEKNLMDHIVALMKDRDHKVAKSDDAPEYFKKNGEDINAKDAVALILQNYASYEEDEWNEEALKAMAVIIFTNLKFRDNGFDISDVKLANSASADVRQAVDEVYGEYLTYDDNVIAVPFHRFSAGKTAMSSTVFGVDLPYIKSMYIDKDRYVENFDYDVRITTSELSSIFLKATSVNLSEQSQNPAEWITIESQDGAVNKTTGYVQEIHVANLVYSGYDFAKLISENSENKITSVCFSVKYNESEKVFVFHCYGYGSGVGMSQRDAIRTARNDKKTYDEILAYYYPDTELVLLPEEEPTEEESTTQATTTETSTTTETTTQANN